MSAILANGIFSILQTPFHKVGDVDEESLAALVEDAIEAGVHGLVTPAVASEADYLDAEERGRIVQTVAATIGGRVPWILGASSSDALVSASLARPAAELGATACLVAVPARLYENPDAILTFFEDFCRVCQTPLIIQDLEFQGPGMDLDTILRLRDRLPSLVGLKIETLPAGPKYSAVREALGDDCFVAGGWAVGQMIEALDRGVNAMMPESSMIRVYVAIDTAYRSNDRDRAVKIFRQLLPVLTFTNQEIATSIAFFKRLLVRKGIFRSAATRQESFTWDRYNEPIADDLIDCYLRLEASLNEL